MPRLPSTCLLALLLPCAACAAVDDSESSFSATVESFLEAHGDFVDGRAGYEPLVRLEGLAHDETEVQSEPGSFRLRTALFEVNVPLPLSDDAFLIAGTTLSTRYFDNSSSFPVADETLYELALLLGYGWFPHPDWMIALEIEPGIYSDLEGSLGSRDWQILGAALATWRYGETSYLAFGIAVDELFAKVDVFPLLGGAWAWSPTWRCDVLLPRSVQVSWTPDEDWILHGRTFLSGASYRVHGDGLFGPGEEDVHLQELRLGFGATRFLGAHLSLTAEVGAALAGNYEFRDVAGPGADGTIEPAFYGSLSLGIGLE